jgi:hypothetical protein
LVGVPPLRWRNGGFAPEPPREVCSICKAARQCDLAKRRPARRHFVHRQFETLGHDVGVRGLSEGVPEGAAEMALAQPQKSGQFVQSYRTLQVGADMVNNAFHLPGSK